MRMLAAAVLLEGFLWPGWVESIAGVRANPGAGVLVIVVGGGGGIRVRT